MSVETTGIVVIVVVVMAMVEESFELRIGRDERVWGKGKIPLRRALHTRTLSCIEHTKK